MLDRLLVLATDPQRKLDLESELSGIERSVAGKLQVTPKWGFHSTEISEALHTNRPQYLHLACDVETGDKGGFAHIRSGDSSTNELALDDLVRHIGAGLRGRRLRQIVLASCHGQDVVEGLTEFADIVIGFRGRLFDDVAVAVMPNLYRWLFQDGVSVAHAIVWAQNAANEIRGCAGDRLLVRTTIDLESTYHNLGKSTRVQAGSPSEAIRRAAARIHGDKQMFTNLPLPSSVQIGDYGFFRGARFIRRGSVTQFDIEIPEPAIESVGDMTWSSEGVRAVCVGPDTAELTFDEAGDYYVDMRGVRQTQLRDYTDLEEGIIRAERRLRWNRSWHVVVESWVATTLSYLIAESGDARVSVAARGKGALHLAGPDTNEVRARAGGLHESLDNKHVTVVFRTAKLTGYLVWKQLRTDGSLEEVYTQQLEASSLDDFLGETVEGED